MIGQHFWLTYHLDVVEKDFYFRCSFSEKGILLIDNSYIADVCKAWSTLGFKNLTGKFKNDII